MTRRRRICVVTTSRADYGCLFELMKEIDRDEELTLLLVATGMHLSSGQGNTASEIVKDGFKISRSVEMLLASDTESAISKSIGVGLISFADVYAELRPDIVVLLGDRFELFAPAIVALVQRIPIAHIHGGETSEGAIDESVRHSITKMASIHFPATEIYRKRIIQMGESPDRVFNCGAPGIDALYKERLLTKQDLSERLQLALDGKVAIVTYHPVTLEAEQTHQQIRNLLAAIETSGIKIVFTKANADTHGTAINNAIKDFCRGDPERYRLYDHLGHRNYLSCLQHFDLMIGNSSSGLIEAPSFRLPVINVGNRQKGRVRAPNVIDVGYSKDDIMHGIAEALSAGFRQSLRELANPYDEHADGRSSFRIKELLKNISISPELLKKHFYDYR